MLSLIVFSVIYVTGLATAREYHINRLIFDVTEPLNDIMQGKFEEKDLVKNLNTLYSFNGEDLKKRVLYYAADGKTIAEMENQTLQFYKIVNKTIGITSEQNLLVSWTINITTLNILKFPSHIKRELNLKPAIIINLPDETECNQQLDSNSWYSLLGQPNGTVFPDGFIGISFNESLIQCDFTKNMRVYAKIVVVKIKFGNTIGVQESFGLFQNRFKFLSNSTTSLLYKLWIGVSRHKIVYFPTPDCVGDNNHRELLMKYARIWTSSNKTYGDIVVQGYTAINEPGNFSITTSIANPSAVYLRNSFSWFPLMIAVGFRKQQSFILNDRQWRLFIKEIERLHANPNVAPSIALPLDLIVDYTDYILLGAKFSRPPTWELEEKSMMRSLSLGLINATGVKLSTILFLVTTQCYTNESCEYKNDKKLVEFARKMVASNLVIGCVFESESFQQMDPAAVVNACNGINGTVYILRTTILFYGNQDVSNYSFQYENTVRNKLEQANEIRKNILNTQPLAKVQLELKVKEYESKGTKKYLFCDEVTNELRSPYLEAIINWVNLKNFPIILKRDSPKTYNYYIYHVLFPMLRQLNNPYKEWSSQSKKDKIETGFQLNNATVETHPSFLMRNYLKSNYNWKMDTCIDWKEGKSILKDVDFYSNHVGTTFHTDDMVINRTSSLEEYVIKLQFIFHRFQLAEIVVGTDFPKLIDGISFAVNVLNISSPKIFVCYVPSNDEPLKEIKKFQSLLGSVAENTLSLSKELSGIHVELAHTQVLMENGKYIINITNGDSVLRMLKLIKQSKLKAGLLASVEICGEMIKNTMLSRESLEAELLGEADYIICKEESGYRFKDGKKLDYELILDSHLFIKRLANVLFPHLEVNFRVELQIEINENRTVLTKYMSLVDLFKTFGSIYDISYFIVEAFDNQLREEKTGWWGITNSSDLTNPKSYVEKLIVYNGQIMWYPPTTDKTSYFPITNGTQNTIIIFASFAVILVLLALVFAVVVRYRKLQQILSDEEVKDFLNGKARENAELRDKETEEVGDLKYLNFNPVHNLELSDICIDNGKILGQGAFGTVYKGIVKEDAAAIKRPNNDCSKAVFMNVLMEVKVLSYIGSHPNVVKFLGAYLKEIHNGILQIATEFCSNGSLQDYLRKKVTVTSDSADNTYDAEELSLHQLDLSRFSLEIAKGMEYIGIKNIVHGDLASRNVLLNENLVCKIGDFGLSRKLYEYQKYVKTSQEPLPWKWMAYESLTKMEFTPKSDVWSYGVTLWEIYSLGKIPYAGLNWSVTFAEELSNGLRPTIPQFSAPEIYNKMCECWNLDVNERPSFTELSTFFQSLSEEAYSVL